LIDGSDSQNNDNQDDQFLSSHRGYRRLQYTIRESSSDADDAIFKGFTSHIPKVGDRGADVDMEDAQYNPDHGDFPVGNAAIAGEDGAFDILLQSPSVARTSPPDVVSTHSPAATDPHSLKKKDPMTGEEGDRFIEESDASGSDYEETMVIANMRRQERLLCRDLTPTMEEQDEMDDKEFVAEANPSPQRFTASQKNRVMLMSSLTAPLLMLRMRVTTMGRMRAITMRNQMGNLRLLSRWRNSSTRKPRMPPMSHASFRWYLHVNPGLITRIQIVKAKVLMATTRMSPKRRS
jgi:hypothetical protein